MFFFCLGYDALLDMISWRPCRSLPRDRSTVRLSPKIFLTLADHHIIYKAYALFNTSRSVAAMVHKGLLANIGAHGEPPLGLNYHAEMVFTAKGGLSNYEVKGSIWFYRFHSYLIFFVKIGDTSCNIFWCQDSWNIPIVGVSFAWKTS